MYTLPSPAFPRYSSLMQWTELQRIDYLSITKISLMLGALWGALQWLLGGFAILLLRMFDSSIDPSLFPPMFSLGDLAGTLVASLIGSLVTALVGAAAYNWYAAKFGGLLFGLEKMTVKKTERE